MTEAQAARYFESLQEFDAFWEGLKASVRADLELSEAVRKRRLDYLAKVHFEDGIRLGFFRVVGRVDVEATADGSVELTLKEGA